MSKDSQEGTSRQGGNAKGLLSKFGNLWGTVAERYEAEGADRIIDRATFHRLVSTGAFSQTLLLTDRTLLEPLIDWQTDCLTQLGWRLADLPEAFHETEELPPSQLFVRAGRGVSADFLRSLAYLKMIQDNIRPDFSPRLILEIGSGFGGFSRLLQLAIRPHVSA